MRTVRAGVAVLTAASALVIPAVVTAGIAQAAPRPASGPAAEHAPGPQTRPDTGWLPSTPANWPLVVGATTTRSTTITSGVSEYSQTLDTVAGRQHTQVLNVDLNNPNVAVRAVEAGDKTVDPADETVGSMGARTGALAGINGGLFAINGTGEPNGGSIVDGTIFKTPQSGFNAELSVLPDGSMSIGAVNFSGTITSGSATQPLTSINNVADAVAGNITELTPDLAAAPVPSSKAGAVVTAAVSGPSTNQMLTVTAVATGVTALPVPATGQVELFGTGGGANWIKANVAVGDVLTVSDALSPDATQLITGNVELIKDGVAFADPTGQPPGGVNPETAVGISKDGRHAIFVTLDGRLGESVATGVTPDEVTGYLLAHGAYNAILLDGGGSTEMDARLPGDTGLSVLNTPSDGQLRPVANGLFVYSTEATPRSAVSATVNQGKPMDVLTGTSEPLPAYALDAARNPASSPVSVSVSPRSLGTVTGTESGGTGLTLHSGARSGHGWLVVRAGWASSREPLTVTDRPASLAVSPAEPDLANGATQQFALSGTVSPGSPLTVGAADATWSVSPADLGTITPDGLFTAAATGGGLATVTATADGRSATASVAVGSAGQVEDTMTDTADWGLNLTNGSKATLAEDTTDMAVPGDAGSMDVHYTIPAASGVSQVVLFPSGGITVDVNAAGQRPTAIGLWVKGVGVAGAGGDANSKPLDKGVLTLAESWVEAGGQTDTTYETPVNYDGWRFITLPISASAQLPLTLSFLDLLVINPASTLSGDVDVADLQALYSPRQPTTPTYVPIPKNPSWLRFVNSPAQFERGGSTIASFDDSHLVASNTGSTGTVVTDKINSDIAALPANAAPNVLQVNGDLTDDGTVADLQYGLSTLQSFGIPFHDAAGNHEITQGANPENLNWSSLFGPTHYSYTDGAANVIVTDSSEGGLLASDAFQVPDEEQYDWLVSQLAANTSKVVVLLTHMPPYDPHVVNNSHFGDVWEAQMYEQLATTYQRTHPGVHVMLLFGHARGVSEQLLDPQGQSDPNGLPNFVVADAGVPAYAPVDQGGFYNYALFHVTPRGDVQFAIQPVLDSITVSAAQASLTRGTREQLTATGTTPTGDDLDALAVPIADPASHQWTSSNPRVARVDPSTGVVTAVQPGTATISVLSGGVTGTTTITVTK